MTLFPAPPTCNSKTQPKSETQSEENRTRIPRASWVLSLPRPIKIKFGKENLSPWGNEPEKKSKKRVKGKLILSTPPDRVSAAENAKVF